LRVPFGKEGVITIKTIHQRMQLSTSSNMTSFEMHRLVECAGRKWIKSRSSIVQAVKPIHLIENKIAGLDDGDIIHNELVCFKKFRTTESVTGRCWKIMVLLSPPLATALAKLR
jgi:hypothetical protein